MSRVELARVRQVCEGLRCTPYDLWGTAGARSVAHAYGPSEWPANVEPLVPVEGLGDESAMAAAAVGPATIEAPEHEPAIDMELELSP